MKRAIVAAMAREGIDPETAARVLASLYGDAGPIDLRQFSPLIVTTPRDTYLIRAERFRQILDELDPLHAAHYAETEKYRAGLPMDPDYQAMADREQFGRLLQVTARTAGGELVGHVRMYLERSLHTRTTYAQPPAAEEDTLYVAPAHRGGPVAIRMMRYVQKCLLTLGVREIRANSKLSNHADVLMRRLGYPAVATQFARIFSAQEAALILGEDGAHEPSPQASP